MVENLLIREKKKTLSSRAWRESASQSAIVTPILLTQPLQNTWFEKHDHRKTHGLRHANVKKAVVSVGFRIRLFHRVQTPEWRINGETDMQTERGTQNQRETDRRIE